MYEEEEMDYDKDINYEEEYEDKIMDIEQNEQNNNKTLDYEIIEQENIMKKRESLIEEFMECSCLNYDEAELVLNHFKWNYDKLVEVWYDNMEEIKIDSHIEQSPESIVNINEYFENNFLYENTCIICGDIKNNEDFIYLKYEHKACYSCMGTYLMDTLFSENKNVLSTLCPLKACNLYVTRSIYKKCIKDEEILKLYEESIKNIFINNNGNIKKCPNKCCNYFIQTHFNISKEIKCKCGLIFCFSCLEESHSTCLCEMVKQWSLMEKEIKFNNDCPQLKPFVNCPNCKDKKSKNKISNHIKCECDEEFCYNCESKWSNHNNNCYDHEEGKNKFFKFYKIVKKIDNDYSFCINLKGIINNYMQDLAKKNLLISDVQFLNEVLDLIEDYYKFYKYLYIFRYFLFYDVDDNFLNYNFYFYMHRLIKL